MISVETTIKKAPLFCRDAFIINRFPSFPVRDSERLYGFGRHDVEEILVDAAVVVQFRMEGCNQLVTLTSSYNLAIYLGIAPYLFNIRSTDETHTENVNASSK